MENPNPNPAPAPTPTPTVTPEPAPAPMPSATPQNSSLTPTPGAKSTHGGLIAIIIVAMLLVIGGIVAAIILIPKGDGGEKKEDNTSKKEEKKDNPTGGDGGESKPVEPVKGQISVTFDGFSFNVGSYFGDNARSLAKAGKIYIEDEDNFGLKELTDLEKYLTTTFDSEAEDKTYPAIYLTKDAKEHSASTVVLSGYFFSSNGDTKKSYDKLRSYVALWCEKKEKITISGKSFQCGVTKSADVLSAFKNAEKDYGNVTVKLDGYDVSFMFDDDILEEVMIDRYDLTD